MKIAIIDGEPEYIKILEDILRRELEKFSIGGVKIDKYYSGEQFLREWSCGMYQLIVIDIFIGGITGIDVAKNIRETDRDVEIVFCTVSNDFASESYDVNASYYLKKPITEESMDKMLMKLDLSRIAENRRITMPDGKKIILQAILYTEYSNHKVSIFLNRYPTYEIRLSMKELENILLVYDNFTKINRGNMINMDKVTCISRDGVTLIDGTKLAISRARFKDVSIRYEKFQTEKKRFRSQ